MFPASTIPSVATGLLAFGYSNLVTCIQASFTCLCHQIHHSELGLELWLSGRCSVQSGDDLPVCPVNIPDRHGAPVHLLRVGDPLPILQLFSAWRVLYWPYSSTERSKVHSHVVNLPSRFFDPQAASKAASFPAIVKGRHVRKERWTFGGFPRSRPNNQVA